jgi:hypothetical protein
MNHRKTRRPLAHDVLEVLDRLPFRVFELDPGVWSGRRKIASWSPIDPRHEEANGPLQSVTMQFGQIRAGATWWQVESCMRGAWANEERARAALALPLLADHVAHYGANAKSSRHSNERDRLERHAAVEYAMLPVDGALVSFCIVRARELAAAAADVAESGIVILGRGDPHSLSLRTLRQLDA